MSVRSSGFGINWWLRASSAGEYSRTGFKNVKGNIKNPHQEDEFLFDASPTAHQNGVLGLKAIRSKPASSIMPRISPAVKRFSNLVAILSSASVRITYRLRCR